MAVDNLVNPLKKIEEFRRNNFSHTSADEFFEEVKEVAANPLKAMDLQILPSLDCQAPQR